MATDWAVRVERTCARELDAKQLRIEVLRDLAVAVAFDAHLWALTDPVTRVATSPVATVPGLNWPRLPELIRTRYLSRTLHWTVLLDEHRLVDTLCGATGGDLSRSLFWREFQRELGVTDVALMVLADRFGCWAALDLWRFSPHPPFRPTRWLGSPSSRRSSPPRYAAVRHAVSLTARQRGRWGRRS